MSDGKKIALTCFAMCFAEAIRWGTNGMQKTIVSLSNIANKKQWDDFFKHSNAVILTETQGQSSESF